MHPLEMTNKTEEISVYVQQLIILISIVLWSVMFWYGSTYSIPQALYGVFFLGGSVIIYSLFELKNAIEDNVQYRSLLMATLGVAGVIITVLSYVEYENMLNSRATSPETIHYALALCVIFVVLYLTYDAFGSIFSIIVILTFLYAYFGPYFPGVFFHTGMSEYRILEVSVINMAGMYGRLTQVGATMVAPFLLFAGLIKGFGGFGVMLGFSTWIAKYLRTGIAQMATIMSMAVGSISGSAAANTSITGSFTIPLMNESGIDREKSAAIESVSSSGGQILPPVMGVAAFLMADLLALPIFAIFTAALIPAIVYYVIVANGVRWTAISCLNDGESLEVNEETATNIDDHPMVTFVPEMPSLLYGTQFLLAVAYLLYSLGVERQPVLIAGNRTVALSIILGIIYISVDKLYFKNEQPGIKESILNILSLVKLGIIDGAKTTAGIMIILASIGAVIDILLTTGFPTMMSLMLSDIAGDSLFILLIMTMVTAIILGMGMPTPAAYLIVAILLAPSLTQAGIAELNAHFFVFYYAILSAITPPIAVGIIISSSISSSNFWRTSLEALKLAIPLFILPFSFIYYPKIISPEASSYLLGSLYGALVLSALLTISYGLNASGVPFTDLSNRKHMFTYKGALLAVGIFILSVPIVFV
jgi:TRAP transporter 4TM/12TM fusion protein